MEHLESCNSMRNFKGKELGTLDIYIQRYRVPFWKSPECKYLCREFALDLFKCLIGWLNGLLITLNNLEFI